MSCPLVISRVPHRPHVSEDCKSLEILRAHQLKVTLKRLHAKIPQTLTEWRPAQDELKYWEGYTKDGYVAGSEFTLAGELAICHP